MYSYSFTETFLLTILFYSCVVLAGDQLRLFEMYGDQNWMFKWAPSCTVNYIKKQQYNKTVVDFQIPQFTKSDILTIYVALKHNN